MNLNLTPVEVNIDIESLSLERDAFYNVCFITENDDALRTIEVNNLKSLIEHGYGRDSLAYNFCASIFAQQKMESVFIRAKRTSESYIEAYKAENNDKYYFVVLQSKNIDVLVDFNDYLTSNKDVKLQFYSSSYAPIPNKKMVHYYQSPPHIYDNVTERVGIGEVYRQLALLVNVHLFGKPENIPDYVLRDADYYLGKAYEVSAKIVNEYKYTPLDFQRMKPAYPEAVWIAECGSQFPSSVQWLYKYLSKVEVYNKLDIHPLSNTSAMVYKNKATVGSGTTTQGIIIHEQVSLDWVQWALSRKVWSTLYNNEKINATQGGLALIVNDAKQVLDVAIEEGIFSEYRITDTKIDARSNKVSLYFTATLVQSILNVEVNGSLHY